MDESLPTSASAVADMPGFVECRMRSPVMDPSHTTRHDSGYRPRPDRSKPPRGDRTRAETALAAAMLLVVAAWMAVEPLVLVALIVTASATMLAVLLPLAVIRAVAALDALHLTARRSVQEWLVRLESDENTAGEGTPTDQ